MLGRVGHGLERREVERRFHRWVQPAHVGEGRADRDGRSSCDVIEGMEDSDFVAGSTCLMIVPGTYDFKVVDNLVTNFHAPDSTLMLLVSAFLGTAKVKQVYQQAQDRGYRFLSYGDVCLFSRPGCKLPGDR